MNFCSDLISGNKISLDELGENILRLVWLGGCKNQMEEELLLWRVVMW